jgi:hypothetical protein
VLAGYAQVSFALVELAGGGEVSEADLDLLDSAFARNGIDNLTRAHRAFEPWPGARAVVVTAWVCPTGVCTRTTTNEGPSCRLTAQLFRETTVEL